jgi:hypothetical protein
MTAVSPKLKHFLAGFGLATVAIFVLPIVADSFGAVPPEPTFQVNRAIKNDRLIVPNMTVAKRRVPVEIVRETPEPSPSQPPRRPEDTTKKIMDGCEPAFSAVAAPTLAHIASRCVG